MSGWFWPKKISLFLFFAVIFFSSGFLSYLSLKKLDRAKEVPSVEKTATVEVLKNQTAPSKSLVSDNELSVLFLGYGGAGHDGGLLSDVLILTYVNIEQKKVFLISIPRDLWVEIPTRSDIKEAHKINMAHAIGLSDKKYPLKEPRFKGKTGGGEMAKHVVEVVTNIPVDYFVSVSFSDFEEAIDILGGVEVKVPTTFDDYFYPVKGLENETCGFAAAEIELIHRKYSGFELEKQFQCRYEHLHFDQGKTQMDGQTALKFVRSRHSAQHGGDFARSKRQQALLLGIRDKLLSLNALSSSKEFVDKMSHTIQTDFDLAAMESLLSIIGNPGEYEVNFLSLTTENVLQESRSANGQFILIPKTGVGNWSRVHEFIATNL